MSVTRKMTTDERRKDEIRRLRALKLELEERILKLRRMQGKLTSTSSSNSVCFDIGRPDGKKVTAAAVWHDVAMRHKRLRFGAEEENARLRAMVEKQCRAFTRTRRLLRRESLEGSSILDSRQKTSLDGHSSPNEDGFDAFSSDDLQVLECLLLDIQGPGMPYSVPLVSHAAPQIRRISSSRIVLEFTRTREVPFHFEALASSLWENTLDTYNTAPPLQLQRVVEQNAALLASYRADHSTGNQSIKTCGDVATQRHDFTDRVEFAFSGISRPMEVQDELISGITLRETGVAVCSRAADSVEGFISQLKMTLVIDVEADQATGGQRNLDTVISVLAQTNSFYLEQGLTAVEGRLLRHQATI